MEEYFKKLDATINHSLMENNIIPLSSVLVILDSFWGYDEPTIELPSLTIHRLDKQHHTLIIKNNNGIED